MKKLLGSSILFACLMLVSSCSDTRQLHLPATGEIKGLRYLDEYIIPHNYKFQNTTVGGLSGIDYHAATNDWFLISDDRSAINPARFYKAKIMLSATGIDSVYFTEIQYLLQPGGSRYPPHKKDPAVAPDPESIRFYPPTGQLAWSSEGERIIKPTDTVLQDPAINFISANGQFKGTVPLPPMLQMQAVAKGPIQNGVFEGMSFGDNYKSLYTSLEEPLYEDGPRAAVADSNAFTRIFRFNLKRQKLSASFAYKLSPVAKPASPLTAFKINGISEILELGSNKLLVVERSFSTGSLHCTIRVYLCNLAGATDIKNMAALKGQSFLPASKKLLLNMDDLGIYIDNIEGISYGPTLPNGHRTLLFISDNNFNPLEKTQLLLFEIIE